MQIHPLRDVADICDALEHIDDVNQIDDEKEYYDKEKEDAADQHDLNALHGIVDDRPKGKHQPDGDEAENRINNPNRFTSANLPCQQRGRA